jgi:uncharacterized membrane protein YqhA
MFERILTGGRYMTLIAVIGSFIAAFTLLLYSGLKIFLIIFQTFVQLRLNATIDKQVLLTFVEVMDLFLLATVFYIIAVGLYELFINDKLVLPAWLVIHNFDDLKGKLISVLIVVLGVLFLSKAIDWDGKIGILYFGLAIAAIILALSYFLSQKIKKPVKSASDEE